MRGELLSAVSLNTHLAGSTAEATYYVAQRGTQVCLSAVRSRDLLISTTCAPVADLNRRGVVPLITTSGGRTVLAGIVPDRVTSLVLDGSPIIPTRNFFVVDTLDARVRSFDVVDRDGKATPVRLPQIDRRDCDPEDPSCEPPSEDPQGGEPQGEEPSSSGSEDSMDVLLADAWDAVDRDPYTTYWRAPIGAYAWQSNYRYSRKYSNSVYDFTAGDAYVGARTERKDFEDIDTAYGINDAGQRFPRRAAYALCAHLETGKYRDLGCTYYK